MATRRRKNAKSRQRKVAVGFFTKDKQVRPITKSATEFNRKKIVRQPTHFKKISPSLFNRLKSLNAQNVVLHRFAKPKKEFMFGTEVLRYGKISFDFNGRHVEDDVIIVPHEFWVASWSRYKPEVYIDDNLLKKYWPFTSLHEAVEKHVVEVYHLEPEIEAHKVAEPVEERQFLKHFTKKDWVDYDWRCEEIQRKEWIYLKQFGTPMLTPIIRTHHGGGKTTPSNVAAEVISSFKGKIFSSGNDVIHFNVAGKNISLRFVDKKEIAPLYGISYNNQGLIKVRNDLPCSVQRHVFTHEIEHQLGRGTEKAANVASFLKDPSGWIQTAGRTLLDPERMKHYLQRTPR